MEVQLLKDNKDIVPGKTIKKGTVMGVATKLGDSLIESKKATKYDGGKPIKKLKVELKDLNDK